MAIHEDLVRKLENDPIVIQFVKDIKSILSNLGYCHGDDPVNHLSYTDGGINIFVGFFELEIEDEDDQENLLIIPISNEDPEDIIKKKCEVFVYEIQNIEKEKHSLESVVGGVLYD